MVGAGFPASVAPLGTALTENQLALLPEGQDPDDLARTGGRGAIEEVIGAARGLVDVIWSREVEGGSFATPERRAALEARINELTGGIRDEVVRRYYRQDLLDRLRQAFAPASAYGGYGRGGFRGNPGGGFGGESGRRFAPRGSFTPGAAGRMEGRGRRPQASAGSQTISHQPYQVASPHLATSPIMLTATMSVHSLRSAPLSACQAMAESRPASVIVTPRFGLRQKKRLSFSTKCRS